MINPLDTPMEHNDALATTIKEYYKALLVALLTEGENFSGKRPFGNSGWEYELYKALINNNLVDGKLDSEGYVEKIDTKEADRLLISLVHML